MIINSDQDSLLIQTDNKLIIRNINEYNLLKYRDFNGKRINLKIGNISIIETYNDGIFNITITNENNDQLKFQVRNTIELCKRIMFNDENLLIEFLQDENKDTINKQFLIKSLTAFYDKLKFSDKDIIINEIFKVDLNGQAYFLKNNNFNPLCIVAVNCDKFKMTQNIGLGNQKIDFKTMEILHKVLFLLNPNTKDSVFMNQLTDKIKKILMENKIVN